MTVNGPRWSKVARVGQKKGLKILVLIVNFPIFLQDQKHFYQS